MRKKTRRLVSIDKRRVWHPFTQMSEWGRSSPVVIEKGEGNYLIDTEGRRYLDGVASLWVNVHGHRKREIDRAIKNQINRISHSTLLGLGNRPSIELAERLVDIAPKGLKKVFYSDNGSTAVEVALKTAFQYCQQTGRPEKKKFLAFTGAYHGDTFGAMSVGEIDCFVKRYRPLLFDALRAPYPYCYRCPIGKKPDTCKAACLGVFEETLKKHHNALAACIIEPLMQGASGMVPSFPGFLKEVRRLTKRHGVLLIADEVATGFGRTGAMFACDKEDVSPDMMCVAKGLTAGYLPLAATLATDEIYNAFLGRYDESKAFFHGHTYTGNPLGCAAAIANIDLMDAGFFKRLEKKIRLFSGLLEGFKGLEYVGDVRHVGLMAGIEIVKDKDTKRPFEPNERVAWSVCMEARRRGILLRPLGDTIVLMPCLSIRQGEIEYLLKTVHALIRKPKICPI